MFARVSEITGPSDGIDQGVAGFRSEVVPALSAMDGFNRAYLLVDRANGKTLAITVWDNEDAMSASEAAADQLRASVTQDMGASGAAVSRFEVVVSEPAN